MDGVKHQKRSAETEMRLTAKVAHYGQGHSNLVTWLVLNHVCAMVEMYKLTFLHVSSAGRQNLDAIAA